MTRRAGHAGNSGRSVRGQSGPAAVVLTALLVGQIAQAQTLDLQCAGQDPAWTLMITSDRAVFDFAERQSEMTIPQVSIAEGRDWPIAMTLIGPRDSAIAIINRPVDGIHPTAILTQRGQTPLLLAGQCR